MYLQIIATFCEIYQKLLFSGYGVKLVSYEDIHRHPILQRILNIQFKTRKMSHIWAPTSTHEDVKLAIENLRFFKQKRKSTSITFFTCTLQVCIGILHNFDFYKNSSFIRIYSMNCCDLSLFNYH